MTSRLTSLSYTIPLLLSMAWAPGAIASEHWNQFRGPTGAGVVEGGKLPVEWSQVKNVAWKKRLPGVGWSQPVVWGDKIFVTCAVADDDQPRPDPAQMGPGVGGFAGFFKKFEPPETNYRWLVICLDSSSGEELWQRTAREGRPTIHVHPNNTFATETPAIDAERLIVHFGMTGLYAYDHAGELLWSKDLNAYPTQFGWGTGSSPVMYGDMVYIQCDNDEASSLTAFNKRNGEEVWRVPRDENSNWATPYIWRNTLRTELVTAGGTAMRSYDPKTGKLLWQLEGGGRTASTPVSDGERLYVDSYDRLTGMSGMLIAVKPGAAGNVAIDGDETSARAIAWSAPMKGNRIASPTVCQGFIYQPEQGGGIVCCREAQSGKELFRKRIPGASGFSASPLASGGLLYCVDQAGRTVVLEAGPELKVLTSSTLDEMTWSSPAVAGDRLLIRTVDHLFCIKP
jgi:outer membrane protein assembly factor BamB